MKLKWSSFRAAFAGIAFLVRTQENARWHLLATVLTIILGIALGVTRGEWLALTLAAAMVWVAEALNTALEQACDAVTREQHPQIGHAKDTAAAAVILACFSALIIALIVFVPYLWP
jgi:diacylglycerol kinase (ATP)